MDEKELENKEKEEFVENDGADTVESDSKKLSIQEKILESFKNKKLMTTIVCTILSVVLVVLLFATDLSAMLGSPKEYKIYKYAQECVEKNLRYPNTAKFASFNKTNIKETPSMQAVVNKVTGTEYEDDGATYWWVSGYGTCENALGMELNFKYTVTVKRAKGGYLSCESCIVE